MNKLASTIASLKDILTISDMQAHELDVLTSKTINTRFEFCSEFYSLNDAHPNTIAEALTPYLIAGVQVTSEDMALQARYVERKSAFEFEIELTLSGMVNQLTQHTSISRVTVKPVYAADDLKIDHSTQTIHHNISGDRSELEGIYCIIDLENGQSFLNQMTAEEAKQALYANCHQRLNGVNPYISRAKETDCYLLSCLRRSLKNIAAMQSVTNNDFISTLLNLHDQQYSKAKQLRKVAHINTRFRNCCSQTSNIDTLFKQAQGSVVVPFSHASDKQAKPKQEVDKDVFAPAHKVAVWDGDEFGLGF